MKKLVVSLVFSLCLTAIGHADGGPGYCYECRCNRFVRDYYKGSGSEWYCKCGHLWKQHLFANRPGGLSFNGDIGPCSGNGDVGPSSGDGVWCVAGVVIGVLFALFVFVFVKFWKRIKDCWTKDDTTKSLGVVLIIIGIALIPTGVCIPVSIALCYAGRKLFSDGHL